MKKWIIFDLDGTLSDPMIGITTAVKYALSKFGIPVQYLKELTPFIGPPLRESFMACQRKNLWQNWRKLSLRFYKKNRRRAEDL